MGRRWRPSRPARPRGRCRAGPRPRWRRDRPCAGAAPARSSQVSLTSSVPFLPPVAGGYLDEFLPVRVASRNRGHPARGQRPQCGRSLAGFQGCALADDRPGTHLSHLSAVDLYRERAVHDQVKLVSGLTLLDQRLALGQVATLGLAALDHHPTELALELALDLLGERRRVIGAPRRALAESVVDPRGEVGQAGFLDQLAAVVVDPVTREGAGAGQSVLNVAVAADGERARCPCDSGIDLEEGLACNRSRRRYAGAPSARLREADVCVGDLRQRPDVGHGLGLHGHGLGTKLQPGRADAALAVLAVPGDPPVPDLDPAAPLVALSEEVLTVPAVDIVKL